MMLEKRKKLCPDFTCIWVGKIIHTLGTTLYSIVPKILQFNPMWLQHEMCYSSLTICLEVTLEGGNSSPKERKRMREEGNVYFFTSRCCKN